MVEALKRIILRLFPELKNGYHKPMLARVVAITDPPKSGGLCDLFRPRYAVDLQPVDHHLKDKGPILPGVPVAVPYAGNHRGFYALPDVGVYVELCFAYALPSLPFVRSVLPINQELAPVDKDEARWQHSPDCYQGYDKDGNWAQIGRIHQSRAAIKQIMKSPKTWVGSDSENVLKILSEFMETTAAALEELAGHSHLPNSLPNVQKSVEAKAASIGEMKSGRLDPITE
ncbi:hypothetical protein CI610_03627 [invertebrate metagenome]|uniref:Gp5/Type VI secretion system Vgr protein OB-fold domain-containing protein n=1 Tax=invertebrate metagenome TaxID=1711999 RepID=A0A2H9T2K4_9ZZZZ